MTMLDTIVREASRRLGPVRQKSASYDEPVDESCLASGGEDSEVRLDCQSPAGAWRWISIRRRRGI